jgi:5-methylcytosine-specific restriction endonuclease McrA
MNGAEATRLKRLRNGALKRQRGLCFWCREEINADAPQHDWKSLTADHVIPRSRGGATSYMNIVAACRACNETRQNINEHFDVETPSSPFEVLKQMFAGQDGGK